MDKRIKGMADILAAKLADEGRLIEGGWVGFRTVFAPAEGAAAEAKLRLAYIAGCQHIFASIMSVLDEDSEPTEQDMRRMDSVQRELAAVAEELYLAYIAKRH